MPTPLTPDEEFDAQFRLGFEHYPEQPEDPAAWHRMELLLDADLRQQALRRRVWHLLGAEAVLLVLGVWVAFSFLLEKMPISAGPPPLATTGRAAEASFDARRNLATATSRGQATEKAVLPAPAVSRPRLPMVAAKEAARLARQASTPAAKPSASGNLTFHRQAASASSTVALRQSAVASRSQRSRSAVGSNAQGISERNATAIYRSAKANHALASFQKKPRLHQSAEAGAQTLVAAGRRKPPYHTVASSPGKTTPKAAYSLIASNRHAAASLVKAGGHAAAPAGSAPVSLPIDLLAPRWPASGLRCQLPDSLALLVLPTTHPIDSLDQPRPRPLLSAYRFRLGLVGAPELSTVRADRLSKPGSSLGVVLEYQLGRRWRVSAGYLYTTKIYVARGTDYTLPVGYTLPHGYVISNVSATCRIVDIPLNLRYDLWQRPHYQVFVSAGLSSLLMRREQYTYDYELVYGKPVAPYSWELDNGSQHVLKILNLSAGYERAVGQRWTVQAEPFVKLPLAGVGFGAVRLSSAGVFFSLKYGLLPVPPAPAPH